MVNCLGGSTQGPDNDRTRQPAISLLFLYILSCGMGCCLEHEFVNQLSIQTTFSDSQADYYAQCHYSGAYTFTNYVQPMVYESIIDPWGDILRGKMPV